MSLGIYLLASCIAFPYIFQLGRVAIVSTRLFFWYLLGNTAFAMYQPVRLIISILTFLPCIAAISSSFEERKRPEIIHKEDVLDCVYTYTCEADPYLIKRGSVIRHVGPKLRELSNIHHRRDTKAVIDQGVYHHVCSRDAMFEEMEGSGPKPKPRKQAQNPLQIFSQSPPKSPSKHTPPGNPPKSPSKPPISKPKNPRAYY